MSESKHPGMRRCLCGHLEATHRFRPRDILRRRGDCLQCPCGRFAWNNLVELPMRPVTAPAAPPPASGARPAAGDLLTGALSLALHTANKRLLELGDRMGAIPVPGCVCLVCAPVPARVPPAERVVKRFRERDILDDIEKYAADYRHTHRLPAGAMLHLVVKGGLSRLIDAAGDRLKLTGEAIPADSMKTWLRARDLELQPTDAMPFDVVVSPNWSLLIYSPGVTDFLFMRETRKTPWPPGK